MRLPGRGGRRLAGQDFEQLRRDCRQGRRLFVDPLFPPGNVSLFLDTNRSADIVWRRPGELCEDPRLFVEGASPNDVTQGILGNCWFVSACSALTHNQALLEKVIPAAEAQEWGPGYCGLFRFQFWRFGHWLEVVIDDLLPTKDGKLLFARSKTPNEFWSALLEKAFAKLYGCYENLVGGHLADALQDVSGGVAETINVRKFLAEPGQGSAADLFRQMQAAFDQQALIVAAIAAKSKDDVEKSLNCGLVVGHAYAVTAVRYIELDAMQAPAEAGFDQSRASLLFSGPMRQMMIRLQNPWGEKEWNGPWADDSPEWEQVTGWQKKELGITVDEDGEFWMPWDEFVRYFTDISLCQLFNTRAARAGPRFHEAVFFDRWTSNGVKLGAPDDRAGGCANFPGTFCLNPQFGLEVRRPGAELMLALTQRETPPSTGRQREPFITIGMHVMRVECNRQHRIHQAINPVATSEYVGSRSVYLHLRGLPAGRFVVVPTTYAPREQADFMLRIYSTEQVRPRLLRDPPPPFELFGLRSCVRTRTVTRVLLLGLDFLAPRPAALCLGAVFDGRRSRSPVRPADADQLSLDEAFVFYSRLAEPRRVTLEVWASAPKRGSLTLWARARLDFRTDNDAAELSLDLAQRERPLARLRLQISSYDDPFYL